MRRGRSNRLRVKANLKKAFNQTARELSDKFQEVISTPRTWDGFEGSVTYRANGSVVSGSFRNIEDLGNLLSSQNSEISSNKATYSWDGNGLTPVLSVFFGHRTETGFVSGRDWITPAIEELNIPLTFKENFR